MLEKDASSTKKATQGAPDSPSGQRERRPSNASDASAADPLDLPREYGGRKGPEPVRYGDWEKNGRCIDF